MTQVDFSFEQTSCPLGHNYNIWHVDGNFLVNAS